MTGRRSCLPQAVWMTTRSAVSFSICSLHELNLGILIAPFLVGPNLRTCLANQLHFSNTSSHAWWISWESGVLLPGRSTHHTESRWPCVTLPVSHRPARSVDCLWRRSSRSRDLEIYSSSWRGLPLAKYSRTNVGHGSRFPHVCRDWRSAFIFRSGLWGKRHLYNLRRNSVVIHCSCNHLFSSQFLLCFYCCGTLLLQLPLVLNICWFSCCDTSPLHCCLLYQSQFAIVIFLVWYVAHTLLLIIYFTFLSWFAIKLLLL